MSDNRSMTATDEVRQRVLVLRKQAERAREEAVHNRVLADAQDAEADRIDTVADQYVALIGSTSERPLFGDVHIH